MTGNGQNNNEVFLPTAPSFQPIHLRLKILLVVLQDSLPSGSEGVGHMVRRKSFTKATRQSVISYIEGKKRSREVPVSISFRGFVYQTGIARWINDEKNNYLRGVFHSHGSKLHLNFLNSVNICATQTVPYWKNAICLPSGWLCLCSDDTVYLEARWLLFLREHLRNQ